MRAVRRPAYSRLREQGVLWVLTGTGGDELCFQRPEERAAVGDGWKLHRVPDHLGPRARAHVEFLAEGLAPASALHASTLLALSTHSATAMRHGLWPISPLAAPPVLRFVQSLPHKWRRDKFLLRELLRQAGYPQDVVRPPVPENFREICDSAMHRHGVPLLERLLPDLLLAEAGLIAPESLAEACAAVAATGLDGRELYRPLALEVSLRSLVAARAAT
ncbi:asparagine synthase-related protein [Streptomyces aureocirculatus]|uniref:asparagine synthase-related protein n=1 Tax=Streptomyces aureocirculatus TaxID=67275 RepID=UPI0004C4E69B|nr:asparagine synthase-related protein [Streptomyces aureocirculatus]